MARPGGRRAYIVGVPYNGRMETIAIIGGGAAGLAAAAAAASELVAAGGSKKIDGVCAAGDCDAIEVVVFEADERMGRSILATGNGRCNFSNAHVDAVKYRNSAFVARAFAAIDALAGEGDLACAFASAFGFAPGFAFTPADKDSESLLAIGAADIVGNAGCVPVNASAFDGSVPALAPAANNPVHAFFANLGLVWREEGEGRLYPLANKASSVLDVLRSALARLGVRVECDRRATRIDPPEHPGGRYHVRFSDGSIAHAREVVVATGGRTARELLPGSLPFVEQRCVLGPLRTDDGVVKSLNNVRVRCSVTLFSSEGSQKAKESGEVLFRDYGVSGIAVFNLSRFAEPGDVLHIDLLPHLDLRACEDVLRLRLRRFGKEWHFGLLLPSVARAACKQAGLQVDAALGEHDVPVLARALKEFSLCVRGVGDAKQCQVTRGGLDAAALDPSTMQVLGSSGLHVVGEAVDVDAPCGGYNLHWAWASGILAGVDSARCLTNGARR